MIVESRASVANIISRPRPLPSRGQSVANLFLFQVQTNMARPIRSSFSAFQMESKILYGLFSSRLLREMSDHNPSEKPGLSLRRRVYAERSTGDRRTFNESPLGSPRLIQPFVLEPRQPVVSWAPSLVTTLRPMPCTTGRRRSIAPGACEPSRVPNLTELVERSTHRGNWPVLPGSENRPGYRRIAGPSLAVPVPFAALRSSARQSAHLPLPGMQSE